MHRHFGESNIVIDFNANKRWTTVSTVRSIKQRSMMAKEDSFERSFGDFQNITRTKELRIVPSSNGEKKYSPQLLLYYF